MYTRTCRRLIIIMRRRVRRMLLRQDRARRQHQVALSPLDTWPVSPSSTQSHGTLPGVRMPNSHIAYPKRACRRCARRATIRCRRCAAAGRIVVSSHVIARVRPTCHRQRIIRHPSPLRNGHSADRALRVPAPMWEAAASNGPPFEPRRRPILNICTFGIVHIRARADSSSGAHRN